MRKPKPGSYEKLKATGLHQDPRRSVTTAAACGSTAFRHRFNHHHVLIPCAWLRPLCVQRRPQTYWAFFEASPWVARKLSGWMRLFFLNLFHDILYIDNDHDHKQQMFRNALSVPWVDDNLWAQTKFLLPQRAVEWSGSVHALLPSFALQLSHLEVYGLKLDQRSGRWSEHQNRVLQIFSN